MVKNKLICIFLLILILLTFTGCTTNSGTDSYYFIVSLGIDKADNGNLKISVQIPATSQSSDSGSSQSSSAEIYSVEARTIDEGFSILDNYLNRKINLSHCSALVISEELAKEGLKTFVYTLSNNTELRHSCELIISSTSAYDVLEKVGNSSESLSSRLFDYLKTCTNCSGLTISTTFGDFFENLHNNSIEPIATYTIISNDTVQVSGIAIFKNEFMVSHIDSIGTIAHAMCVNRLNSTTVTLENPFDKDDYVDLDIELYKDTKISVNVINGSPYIKLTVYPKGTIKSSGSVFNYIENDNIEKLENAANDYFTEIIKNYLYSITKDYNTDVIGIKSVCQSKYLTEEEFNTVHWDDIFQDSFFEVKVNTQINSSNLFNKE